MTEQDKGPPDVNEGMERFDRLQELLDQVAFLSLFASNDHGFGVEPVYAGAARSTQVGIKLDGEARRFDLSSEIRGGRLVATNKAYEPEAHFSSTFRFIPDDYHAYPHKKPPAEALDPTRGQRFAMTETDVRCGKDSGFRGFGSGQTYLISRGETDRLLLAGAGAILEGYGSMAGVEGTFAVNGYITPPGNATLHISIRLDDFDHRYRSDSIPSPGKAIDFPDRHGTYVVFPASKQKIPTELSAIGLGIHEDLRRASIESSGKGPKGPVGKAEIGRLIGTSISTIGFRPDPKGPPGTARSPIPFRSTNTVYTFKNGRKRAIGSFPGDLDEGRTFVRKLPGMGEQPAFRFSGFGRLGAGGDGVFEDTTGVLTFISAGTVAPHVVSDLYVVRFEDREGRFRAD